MYAPPRFYRCRQHCGSSRCSAAHSGCFEYQGDPFEKAVDEESIMFLYYIRVDGHDGQADHHIKHVFGHVMMHDAHHVSQGTAATEATLNACRSYFKAKS